MRSRTATILICLVVVFARPGEAGAQLRVDWYTIDGGGGTSSGGGLTLTGTIGQPDAGTAIGGALEARCGFWAVGPAGCAVDLNGDGQPTPADLAIFITTWFDSLQQGTLAGDFDGNGAVTPADVGVFVSAWFAALTGGGC
jgi:hypothetical protein